MRKRMLAALLAVGLLGSLGAGSRLLLCEMGSVPSYGCDCVHPEQDDSCAAIQRSCCKVSEIASAPAAVWASPDRTNPEHSIALIRAPYGASDLWRSCSRSLRPIDRGLRVRAGPPIFLEICSYLI